MTVKQARTALLNNGIAVGEEYYRLSAVSMNREASVGEKFDDHDIIAYEGYVVDCLPSNSPKAKYDWVILSREK